MTHTKISGAILAGGLSTRMRGNDKGLIHFDGSPLYQHIAAKLQPQVHELLINANRNLEVYQQSGYPIIPDIITDFSGPLAGMLSVLKKAINEWVIFVPCDVPDFPDDLVAKLWQYKQHAWAVYAHDCERAHPTLTLMHRSLIPRLESYLALGERKLMFFMQMIKAKAVYFPDPKAFTNLNTPEECHHWEYQHWDNFQESA
ncbi:molybdenum cofactor guanylyltransferase MobA [Xenorhabdus szentirmaii]|uniref:Molybdenum cofactor guanylyltransferase n=1 Tax=Xenorhabdus szentirmaii DSM 16338 TaxID=1427518 RepID=W1J0A4_9GAMM|nr:MULTISPECIES: molybdenum cofactor guanylyltransferase MobA [Xenorhabdus]MBD2805927.1 molybdenum cofactor guanylyltransferase MobA [Xenorhabdus sp. ZM]MBD2823965.1 molybdenum cofactor guanylyltransferase MobA [Xenorhabdus sp. 5]PHM34717.1 molybdenum cofactor guanylyltransferase [Xenorhabdus szentirmaii DSM 16338]CDL83493.1 putative molybdopterin-guanine dinucleotide biosynthesis protein A [Xenorhabdus szentirmaii DSM 16338]